MSTDSTVGEATPASSKPRRRPLGFAVLVAAGILLSRLAGLVRQRVFAHYFGNSDAAGAFNASVRIPNLLQNLFGEGVLSASFIPVYARLLAEEKEELAGRVAGAVAAFLGLVVSVLVLIGVLFTPLIIDLVAPGFTGDVRLLTIRIVRILFPGVGLLVLSAWCLGVLNSHRKFFLSYVAPVLWNAAMIAAMWIFGSRVAQDRLAIVLAWGSVIGSALQLGIQLPFVFRYGRHFRFALDLALAEVRKVFRNMGPVFVGRGVVQLSAYIDGIIASYLGALAVAALGYAQILYLLPISLFGMSVAAAELPQMSSEVGTTDEVAAALRKRIARGLRQISFFVIPSVAAILIIGDVLVAGLFQTGEFGRNDTLLVWYILIGSTLGMLAATLGRLFNSAFYALHDTKTPLKFATVRVLLTGVLGYLFAFPLRPAVIFVLREILRLPLPSLPGGTVALGAVGLTASAGMAGWVEFLLLRNAMNRRVGRAPFAIGYQVRLWASAIIAGVGARTFDVLASPWLQANLPYLFSLRRILISVIVAGVFGVLYFAGAMVLGVAEARANMKRFLP